MLEVAGGIILAVVILAYLPDILAAGAGILIAIAALILVVAVASMGWEGSIALAAMVASVGGAVWLHKRRHPEDWIDAFEEGSSIRNKSDGLAAKGFSGESPPPKAKLPTGRSFAFTFGDKPESEN